MAARSLLLVPASDGLAWRFKIPQAEAIVFRRLFTLWMVLGFVLLQPAWPAELASGERQVVERARARELAERSALNGRGIDYRVTGTAARGNKVHDIDVMLRLVYGPDLSVRVEFISGLLDGKPTTEAALREEFKLKRKPTTQATLELALAPLSSPVSVTTVTAAGGEARMTVKPLGASKLRSVALVVDATKGVKLSSTLTFGGLTAKFADRAETDIQFAEDGAPSEFHMRFHAQISFYSRAANLTGRRLSAQSGAHRSRTLSTGGSPTL